MVGQQLVIRGAGAAEHAKVQVSSYLVPCVSVSLLRRRIWRPKYFILYCILSPEACMQCCQCSVAPAKFDGYNKKNSSLSISFYFIIINY